MDTIGQVRSLGMDWQNPSRDDDARDCASPAIVLGLGIVMSANAARAEDDEDDSPSRKKSQQLMTGPAAPIGRNWDRLPRRFAAGDASQERPASPRRLSAPKTPAPNWPKDPTGSAARSGAAGKG